MNTKLPLAVAAVLLAGAAPAEAVSGGTTLPIAQSPYIAWVSGRCTGTLISPTRVLTAAHCLDGADAALEDLRIGVDGNVDKSGAKVAVAGYSVNPKFKLSFPFSHATAQSAIAVDDVGLIILKKPVKGIAPIRLATASDAALEAPGTTTRLIGFGLTAPEGDTPPAPTPLQQGSIPRISAADCLASYPKAIDANMGCALDTRASGTVIQACAGDSGGPVVVDTPTGPVQVGVTSWGAEVMDGVCGQTRLPDVFMRTAAFTKFLTQKKPPIAPFSNRTTAGGYVKPVGKARVGQTLTCKLTVKLSGDPAKLRYEWITSDVTGFPPIKGAGHATTLKLTKKLVHSLPEGKRVGCQGTATNAGGQLKLQGGTLGVQG